jgi:imidazolonepropionase-like amidohydrolase
MQAGQLAGLKALRDAGTLVVAGTDTMIAPNLHGEIASYVRGGFTPFQALQTATVNAAKALNLDAGTLEPGKLADIVLIEGIRARISRPLSMREVVANGRPYSVADLLARADKHS